VCVCVCVSGNMDLWAWQGERRGHFKCEQVA